MRRIVNRVRGEEWILWKEGKRGGIVLKSWYRNTKQLQAISDAIAFPLFAGESLAHQLEFILSCYSGDISEETFNIELNFNFQAREGYETKTLIACVWDNYYVDPNVSTDRFSISARIYPSSGQRNDFGNLPKAVLSQFKVSKLPLIRI